MFPESGFLFAPSDSIFFPDFFSHPDFEDLHKDIFLATDVQEIADLELHTKEPLAIPEVEEDDFSSSMKHRDSIPEVDDDSMDRSLKHDDTILGLDGSLNHGDLIQTIPEVDDEEFDCSLKQGNCEGDSTKGNGHPFIALFPDEATACSSMLIVEDMASLPTTISSTLLMPSPTVGGASACGFVDIDKTMVLPSFHVIPTELNLSPRTLAATNKMDSMTLLDEIDASQKAVCASIAEAAALQDFKALESVPHLPPLSPYRSRLPRSPSLFTLPQVTTVTDTLTKRECTPFMDAMLGDIDASNANAMLGNVIMDDIDVPKVNAMLNNVDRSDSGRLRRGSALKPELELPHVYEFSGIQGARQDSLMNFPSASNNSAIQRSHSSHDLGQLRASINHALCHENEPPSELDTFLSRNSDAVSSLPRHGSWNGSWNTQQFIVRPAFPSMRRVYSTGDLQVLANYGGILESPREEEPAGSRIGHCTVEERKIKLHRYRQKRNERNFSKKIKYACRKTLADSRPRIRGRFARTDESDEPESVESFRNRNKHSHSHPEASCVMSNSCTMANTKPTFWTAVGMNVAM